MIVTCYPFSVPTRKSDSCAQTHLPELNRVLYPSEPCAECLLMKVRGDHRLKRRDVLIDSWPLNDWLQSAARNLLLLGMLILTLPPADAQSTVDAKTPDDPAALVLAVANQSVGRQMWLGYGLPSGKLGCAAALCNVLKQAGFPYAKSAAVATVRSQLLSGPARTKEISIKSSGEYGIDRLKLAQVAKPGDLIMGYMKSPDHSNLGSDAHCGVVAGNGEVYANDWLDGVWKRDVVDRFFAWYHYVYIMKILSPVRGHQT